MYSYKFTLLTAPCPNPIDVLSHTHAPPIRLVHNNPREKHSLPRTPCATPPPPPDAGFRSDAGPWTVLGADALVEDEGTYKPDFSAHAGSERLRCVRISKASFDTITSMSRQEGETPPALRIEADNGENAAAADGGGIVDGGSSNITAASGNRGSAIGSGGSAKKNSAAKQRAFSDEGGARNSITSTASCSGGGGGVGTPGTRIALSPPRKRGVPSGASLKILQAATGVAVIPAAATSPTAAQVTQPTDKPPPPPETTALASPAGLVAEDEEAGISLVTTTTTAGLVPPPCSRVAGSEGDVESCSGRPAPDQEQGDDGGRGVNAETQKTARI